MNLQPLKQLPEASPGSTSPTKPQEFNWSCRPFATTPEPEPLLESGTVEGVFAGLLAIAQDIDYPKSGSLRPGLAAQLYGTGRLP